LHLEFAERLPSARRGGKLRAQANSVNSGCAENQQQSLFVAATSNAWRFGSRQDFPNTLFLSFRFEHARLIFLVKKIFLRD